MIFHGTIKGTGLIFSDSFIMVTIYSFKEYLSYKTVYSASALNASSRSSIISSTFSVPIERRIVFGLMP